MEIKNINWKKVITGAGIAAAGAALTYLTEFVTNTNFGLATPIITAAMSVLVNLVRKVQQGDEG